MRQINPRAAATPRTSASAHRSKPKARSPQARTEPRGRARFVLGKRSASLIARLRNSFPFRRPILTLTLGLVAAGVVTGIIAGGYFGKVFDRMEAAVAARFTDAGFGITDITVAGNERTSKEAAIEALGVGQGESIFAVSPSQARERLMRLPWVADAEVKREFPGAISIRLMEKRPFALWRTNTGIAVVERSGAVITAAKPETFARLPMLAGVGAPEAAAPFIDALRSLKAVSARVQTIDRIGERRWDLTLTGGVVVKLPEEGWLAQLNELERLIVEKGILERDIEIIDLRYPDNYVFRLHNGDSRPVPRERRA